jgi:Ataxin 2 SM domain
MASAANSASAANRAPGNNLNPPSQNAGGARQSLRTNASLKGDANRRQSASPGDGGPRYVFDLPYFYAACETVVLEQYMGFCTRDSSSQGRKLSVAAHHDDWPCCLRFATLLPFCFHFSVICFFIKQLITAIDLTHRRSSSQKAWSQGFNPVTQKPSSLQNGNNVQSKATPSPKPSSPKESNNSPAHERLRFLLTSFIVRRNTMLSTIPFLLEIANRSQGLPATIVTKNGEKFNGVFSSSTPQPSGSTFLLKMVQRAASQLESHANGLSDVTTPFIGSGADHSMKFNVEEIDDIIVNNVTTTEVAVKESNGKN